MPPVREAGQPESLRSALEETSADAPAPDAGTPDADVIDGDRLETRRKQPPLPESVASHVHDETPNNRQEDIKEGGAIAQIVRLRTYPKDPPHPESVASYLAWVLLGLLGFTILLHYLMLGVLLYFASGSRAESDLYAEYREDLTSVFHTVLPVVSGLAGAVVTYYFTRQRRQGRA